MTTLSYSFNRGDETIDVEVEYTLEPTPPHNISSMAIFRDGASFMLTAAEMAALDEYIYALRDKERD